MIVETKYKYETELNLLKVKRIRGIQSLKVTVKGINESTGRAAQSLYSLYAVHLVKDTRLGHYYSSGTSPSSFCQSSGASRWCGEATAALARQRPEPCSPGPTIVSGRGSSTRPSNFRPVRSASAMRNTPPRPAASAAKSTSWGNKTFRCPQPECGYQADRDANAARNILIRFFTAGTYHLLLLCEGAR
ncbi:hypothetical protein QOT17_023596 [Balamuthia mandrillaris]